MEKKKTQSSKLFIAVIVLFIAVIFTIPSLFAKYKNDKEENGEVVLKDFAVELVPKLDSVALKIDTENSPIANDGTILLTIDEYKTFTLDLKYEGDGKSYIRVLIEESWIYKSGSVETVLINDGSKTNFTVASNITPQGSYFYVNKIVPSEVLPDENGIIAIIKSVAPPIPLPTTNIGSNEATHVKLSIKVEAVQYNRVNAKWGSETPVTTTP